MMSRHTLVSHQYPHPHARLTSVKYSMTYSPLLENPQLPWVQEGLGTY